jgi:hypothetical protein
MLGWSGPQPLTTTACGSATPLHLPQHQARICTVYSVRFFFLPLGGGLTQPQGLSCPVHTSASWSPLQRNNKSVASRSPDRSMHPSLPGLSQEGTAVVMGEEFVLRSSLRPVTGGIFRFLRDRSFSVQAPSRTPLRTAELPIELAHLLISSRQTRGRAGTVIFYHHDDGAPTRAGLVEEIAGRQQSTSSTPRLFFSRSRLCDFLTQ